MQAKHKYKIVFNVLYPAVLGGVLTNFLTKDIPMFIDKISNLSLSFEPRLYFGLVFVIHWTLMFLKYTGIDNVENFDNSELIGYSAVSLCMLSAFYSLPVDSGTSTDYSLFYISVSGIGASFIILDLYRYFNRYSKEFYLPVENIGVVVVIDLLLAVWGCAFVLIDVFQLISHPIMPYIFISGTLLSSLVVIEYDWFFSSITSILPIFQ